MSRENSRYPSTYYRVSVKAIIRNNAGEVLLTKEDNSVWSFPGGGIEHGETALEALQRELYEEAKIDAPFKATPIDIESIFVDHADVWVVLILYEVAFDSSFSFAKGDDVQEVAFKDPDTFKDSDETWERLVYKWAKKSPRN